MFGLFTQKKPAALPDALVDVLRHVAVDDWLLPVIDIASQIELKHTQLVIELPFAADFATPFVQAAVDAAGLSLAVTIRLSAVSTYAFSRVRHLVLVASGKGGVGKSTTAVNLAIAASQQGAKVGLLDADIYGPSIPTMLGEQSTRATSPDNQHLNPIEKFGIALQSIGFLLDPTQASVWRGPMASSALMQLVNETVWPELDVLFVDMPPGTGDIQLTLSQKLAVSGAVIVTTPQDVALADAQKGIAMFRQVNIPLLGLIENMSFYQCPSCGHHDDIFGTDGGKNLAQRYGVTVLGQLPLQRDIRQRSDAGIPIVLETQNQTAEIYRKMARQLLFTLYCQQQLADGQSVEILMTDD